MVLQKEIDQTELVWPNKETEVNPPILPFQTIETVNEPRKGQYFGGWKYFLNTDSLL